MLTGMDPLTMLSSSLPQCIDTSSKGTSICLRHSSTLIKITAGEYFNWHLNGKLTTFLSIRTCLNYLLYYYNWLHLLAPISTTSCVMHKLVLFNMGDYLDFMQLHHKRWARVSFDRTWDGWHEYDKGDHIRSWHGQCKLLTLSPLQLCHVYSFLMLVICPTFHLLDVGHFPVPGWED